MKIEFVKTHEDAKLPEKNHKDPKTGDAGLDMFAVEEVSIPAGQSAVVPVGLKLAFVTPGFFLRIEARSGLGFKKGLQPHFGIIDNSYRGDLGVKIYNLSTETQTINKGQGVAQLIPYVMCETTVTFTDEVKSGERGENGFGSSDKK